jgi:hypothetical protein
LQGLDLLADILLIIRINLKMGNCCPSDNTDTNPKVSTSNSTSPNAKRKQKQSAEVNIFKPGARDVRIT